MMETYAFIKRSIETADVVQRILGLPDQNWCDLHVEFGVDEVATAKVTLLLTGEQLQELAAVAFQRAPGPCHDPD